MRLSYGATRIRTVLVTRYLVWSRNGCAEARNDQHRPKGTYASAQYARIARRRGPNKAAVALANSMLNVVWHLLTNGELYQDLGADYFEKHNDPEAQVKRLAKRIEAFGFDVTVTERVA
ncbi:MAG: hypothetical protein MP439_10615 [Ferrimicrobium sp.]|nr:hypothetical protein [Ferrimicrobium sp.]